MGNVAGAIVAAGGGRHNLVTMNGTAGHRVGRLQEFQYPMPAGSILVLHSDGLSGGWDLASYPGLKSRHPSVIAGVLFRDFSRRRDDVTVVVAKDRPPLGGEAPVFTQTVAIFLAARRHAAAPIRLRPKVPAEMLGFLRNCE